jgi:hypothetical protein
MLSQARNLASRHGYTVLQAVQEWHSSKGSSNGMPLGEVIEKFLAGKSNRSPAYMDKLNTITRLISGACDGGIFHGVHLPCDRLNYPILRSHRILVGNRLLDPLPSRKSGKGEIRAFFSVGDFPIDANSSFVEGLCQSSKLAALMATLAPATYTRFVEGRRFRNP